IAIIITIILVFRTPILNGLNSSPNTKCPVIPIIIYNKIRYNVISMALPKLINIHNIMEAILPTTLIHCPYITAYLKKNVLTILMVLIHAATINFTAKIPNTEYPVVRFYVKTDFLSGSILKTTLDRFSVHICLKAFANTALQSSAI
ncbi:hypothetical protein PoMZ_13486, partial [Pyricularia oryzae]